MPPGSPSLSLYNTAIPSDSSFSYLGVPFNSKSMIDSSLLLDRNIKSAVSSMRSTMQPLGLHSPSFSRLTASRLYAMFIRPKFEYGLAISIFRAGHFKKLEKAQDTCLRLAFGGHSKSSTSVFKHITNLPSLKARIYHLQFKMIVRVSYYLPSDALISILLPRLKVKSSHWSKLCSCNPFWSLISVSESGDSLSLDEINHFVSSTALVKSHLLSYHQSEFNTAVCPNW